MHLGEFEGPLDVLLQCAREQKVDLLQISMADLCDQYLQFIERTIASRLDLASEYLVMASYLTYLKSQILLPEPDIEAEETINHTRLALVQLHQIQQLGQLLHNHPQLGREFYTRGMAQPLALVKKSLFYADINELILAYAYIRGKRNNKFLSIVPTRLESTEVALKRLEALLPRVVDWLKLDDSFDKKYPTTLEARSALAASLCALLELTRDERTELRQNHYKSPLEFRAHRGEVMRHE